MKDHDAGISSKPSKFQKQSETLCYTRNLNLMYLPPQSEIPSNIHRGI